jgi:Co/Zn/Cd efflux system component
MNRDRIKSIESILSIADPEQGGPRPTGRSQYLLLITTLLFTTFVVAEIIGALAGHSLALLGDASAMSVDVFTYICSWYGERIKIRNGGVLDEGSRMLVEVYIPTLSLVALLAVSGYIASDAINILLQPSTESSSVNITYLYAFASANLAVCYLHVVFLVAGVITF